MSIVKYVDELFLEKEELNKEQKFRDEEGLKKSIISQTGKPGIIKNNYTDPAFENGKVLVSSTPSPTPNSIYLTLKNKLLAIDKFGNFISYDISKNISELIDSSNNRIEIDLTVSETYYLKIKYKQSPIEIGKIVSIDIQGNVIGVGTEFTKILRGQPNFPSKIKFVNSSLNTLEYEVVDVLSDTQIILSGVFAAETNVNYKTIGTFSPGYVVPSLDKDIFQYDSCEFELITIQSVIAGEEFILAKIIVDGGTNNYIIEDLRTDQIYKSIADNLTSYLYDIYNPPTYFPFTLIGLESLKFNNPISTQTRNILQLGWGYRSTDWSYTYSALGVLTICFNNAEGGNFKLGDITGFNNDYFVDWRIYYNENYAKIISSTKDIGTGKVYFVVDSINPLFLIDTSQILRITPDFEEIEFRCYSETGDILNSNIQKLFPISEGVGTLEILPIEISGDLQEYNTQFRFKTVNSYTQWINLVSGNYYSESEWDSLGLPNLSQTLTSYIGGKFVPQVAPLGWYGNSTKELNGVSTQEISSSTFASLGGTGNRKFDLIVGINKKHQFFKGTSSLNFLGQQYFIVLDSTTTTKDGAVFLLQFKQNVNIAAWLSSGGSIVIVTNFSHDGGTGISTYDILKQFDLEEYEFMQELYSPNGIYIVATRDSSNNTWLLSETNNWNSFRTLDNSYLVPSADTGTWTLSGTEEDTIIRYKREGKQITVFFNIINSTISNNTWWVRFRLPFAFKTLSGVSSYYMGSGTYENPAIIISSPESGPTKLSVQSGGDLVYIYRAPHTSLYPDHFTGGVTGGLNVSGTFIAEID